MKRVLLAVAAGLLALSVVAPAMAEHENGPGKSTYGRCQALIHGNSQNKWDHGKPFQETFGDVPDGSDEGDTGGELADAIEYCQAYVVDNHPGGGNGNGGGGD